MNLDITAEARERIVNSIQSEDQFVRIRVIAGGCSGMTYDATIDSNMADDDEVVYQEGKLRVVTDMRSGLFLDGLMIDYSDDLIQAGFRITNSNASKSCGCGASFAL
ncbi:MAG: iron-sulfur cluster assembly accessory protein [Lentisphaeria bacterium]|jgi:iron-sulfur cluster assembly protein/iron-sulfur cluster insertion protein|nr:iron-sulfur cluster assembly accessory protein [Lentisphaeria bacterium]MDP7743643.1 iron-sulfur cluster assembly accessory protein [Lentisphaeria bacterium]